MTTPAFFERLRNELIWTRILVIRRLRSINKFFSFGQCGGISAEELERLRSLARTADKWRGIALAKHGDGRTVQQIQGEARAEERKACLEIADSYSIFLVGESISKQIRARSEVKS